MAKNIKMLVLSLFVFFSVIGSHMAEAKVVENCSELSELNGLEKGFSIDHIVKFTRGPVSRGEFEYLFIIDDVIPKSTSNKRNKVRVFNNYLEGYCEEFEQFLCRPFESYGDSFGVVCFGVL